MRLTPLLTVAAFIVAVASPAEARVITVKEGEKHPIVNRHAGRKKVERGPTEYKPWRIRNQQRQKDLTTLGNAFFRYRQAHSDVSPDDILIDIEREICRYGAADCTGLLDLEDEMTDVLPVMPVDPKATNPNGTGYTARKDHKERVWLRAPLAEEKWVIRNTR